MQCKNVHEGTSNCLHSIRDECQWQPSVQIHIIENVNWLWLTSKFKVAGLLPLYLSLIICNCVMNTCMRIMNFINAMPCMCATSPSSGTSHFGCLLLSILAALAPNFACTLVTSMCIILRIIFPFRLSQMAVHPQDMAEVPSLGIFFIHSWLFGELKTKAYVEQCRAYRTMDWMWEDDWQK